MSQFKGIISGNTSDCFSNCADNFGF